LSKNGIATQYSDITDIYANSKSTAREFYTELIDTYYKKYWSLVESSSDPLIREIVTSIKTKVANKKYRFLCKSSNDNQYYVMPDLILDKKIIKAFVQVDGRKGIPDMLKYVDESTIFPSVVCNYTDVDPNTNDAMGKRLLRLVEKRVITNLKIASTYDPNTHHPMNELQPDGRYGTKWASKKIAWDGDRKTERVFDDYFVRQVLREANTKPSSTICDLPSSVVHYQFEYEDRCYRMFLESCPGKFGAFHQYALPCDGSNDLIDDFKTSIVDRTYNQVDFETNDSLPQQFEEFRTSIRRILLTIYDEELGTANPYANHSVSIAYGTDDNSSVELGDFDESTSNNRVHIDMDELSLF